MYVSGHASNLEVLLTSSDISSILTRSEMIKSVSQKDSKTLNDLMDKMNEIEKDKAELEQKDHSSIKIRKSSSHKRTSSTATLQQSTLQRKNSTKRLAKQTQ